MDDWETLVERWQATLRAVERLGGATTLESARRMGIQHSEVWGLFFEPPASPDHVKQIEATIGAPLPSTLRDIFINHSRRIEFRWQFPDAFDPAPPFDQIFSGGFSLSLDQIPEADRCMQKAAAFFLPQSDEYNAPWHKKLAFMEGALGDYYVTERRSPASEAVIYVSDQDGEGHGYTLASDIADFLRRWSMLGCPGPEDWQWIPFTSGSRSMLQPNGEAARLWRKMIGLEFPEAGSLL